MTKEKYHIWPRVYDLRDWRAGSIIKCEGHDCWMCGANWAVAWYAPQEGAAATEPEAG